MIDSSPGRTVTKYYDAQTDVSLEFVADWPEHLICLICQDPCINAKAIKPCGHTYCKHCITKEISESLKTYPSKNPTCPKCRDEILETYSNTRKDNEVKKLLIYCPNKSKGCQWMGEVASLDEHLDEGCRLRCEKCFQLYDPVTNKHLKINCPCYCSNHDIRVEKEVIQHNKYDTVIYNKNLSNSEPTTDNRLNIRNHPTAPLFGCINIILILIIAIAIFVHIFQMQTDYKREEFMEVAPYLLHTKSESKIMWSLELYLSGKEVHNNQLAPIILKMPNFIEKWINKESWYSQSFIAFEGGYKMCLRVDARDPGIGNHVAVYLFLMKGPYDDELRELGYWPLRGHFLIELLNQDGDEDHYEEIIEIDKKSSAECRKRLFHSDMATKGTGNSQFISHETLYHTNSTYLRNNTLYFRVSYLY